jgi:hypothetical protein
MTERLIEVFSDTESIACHLRQSGTGKFSTEEAHYPEQKLGIKRFEAVSARRKAEAVGPQTLALVEHLLDGEYPLKNLRRIQGILRLESSKHISTEALEYACEMGLKYRKPRLQYVKDCAEHFASGPNKARKLKPERKQPFLYLHVSSAEEGGVQ